MQNETNLSEANFLLFSAQHYKPVVPDTVEFYADIKRFAYVKRLFNLYVEKNDLKERLIINHLIVIINLWDDAAIPMLFLKLEGYESVLKTFLSHLNRMPERINSLGIVKRDIINSKIPVDVGIKKALESL